MQFIATWLPNLGAALMVFVGLVGVFKPASMIDPLGISTSSPLGISEVRAIFGGLQLGGGLAALVLQDQSVFVALAMGWLAATLVRFYSMAVDGLTFRGAVPALFVDGGLALLLLSALL